MLEHETQLKALMTLSQQGDPNATRQLLNSLKEPLLRYFRNRLFGCRSDAEDLTQETLLAIHSHRARFDPAQSMNSWCFTLARNKLIDHIRRLRRVSSERLAEEIDPAAHHRVEDGVMQWDLTRVISGLSPRQRSILLDARVLGFTMAEAAERNGTTANAAKVDVHRSLKTLRARIEAQA